MPTGAPTDEELMSKYQSGDAEAFLHLYERHSGRIWAYIQKRCPWESEVSDIFQEVFVKLHKSKSLYDKNLPALPWIFTVTHSVLMDGLRKKARLKEDFEEDLEKYASEPEAGIKHNLRPYLDHLPPQQKQALNLRYVEEQTFEEIAQRLNTSPMNVRQIVSRGVKHLRSFVKKESLDD